MLPDYPSIHSLSLTIRSTSFASYRGFGRDFSFLAEATMKTVIDYPFKTSAMLYFPTMRSACEAVIKLKKSPVTAVEMFDRLALKSVEDKPDAIPELKTLPSDAAVLLIKTEADKEHILEQNINEIASVISEFNTLYPTRFTNIESEYNAYWTMRSGIFPTVGSARPVGTTCLIEDIAFQVDDLPDATADLRKILIKNNYPEAVIYGHALEGNFHFILNQSFDTPEAVAQYRNMMNEVIDLVVDKYHGSLKAEHGTGRNMAPFVKREWGETAFNLMRDVKQLFDPKGLLNPGVIFNDDPNCHLQNIKPLPKTHELIDKCIECGFCEVNCISNGFTLSSRQRIIIQREITRLKTTGENPKRLKSLENDFVFAGEKSCAGDGLCATSCPVGINVGDYIHFCVINNMKITRLPKKSDNGLGLIFHNFFQTKSCTLDCQRSPFGFREKRYGWINKRITLPERQQYAFVDTFITKARSKTKTTKANGKPTKSRLFSKLPEPDDGNIAR